MDSPCIKQTVCKVLKIFQCGKYLVAYVLKTDIKSDCKHLYRNGVKALVSKFNVIWKERIHSNHGGKPWHAHSDLCKHLGIDSSDRYLNLFLNAYINHHSHTKYLNMI